MNPLILKIATRLPEIAKPPQKPNFGEKFKWTMIILVLFFVLGQITLYGINQDSILRFEYFSQVLASEMGSLISLGIGPIVEASIILQLAMGSGLIKLDTSKPEERQAFQGLQKLLAVFFVIVTSIAYVSLGGISTAEGINPLIVIGQLLLGGIMIIFMDDVINKWGFGQGVSLFIAAGVSKGILVALINPLTQAGQWAYNSVDLPVGALLQIVEFIPQANLAGVITNILAIIATIVVFLFVVYVQAMKVEIPLSFGRIRGHSIRWPLQFLYASVIPVILISGLLATLQAGLQLTGLGENAVAWISPTPLISNAIQQLFGNAAFHPIQLLQALTYTLVLVVGSTLFSVFWVKSAGLDAKSQAKKIMKSGLQIPGFRKDERIIESLLQRYIPTLTILGGITIGILASIADLLGALTTGTGILLTVMVIYKLYEEIAQQHMTEMNPTLKKFIET